MKTVRFDQVSKKFKMPRQRSRSFQELFLGLRRLKLRSPKETYWVLREIDLDVAPGEMLGIIGPNGAGKSTILKLISGIIAPTSGQIEVNGRVGALLELGAGFHPDLTGRENVYLNGAILGLSRSEMQRMFPDIVQFAEMARFIDVPVKHYSTGMYMRLGFSIAIHVQPDILLVDEVLAVGDKTFQLRCLDAINQMRRRGASILLVTHNTEFVRTMCDRAVWLDRGRIQSEGPVEQVYEEYMTWVLHHDEQALLSERQWGRDGHVDEDGSGNGSRGVEARHSSKQRWGTGEAEIIQVQLLDGREQEQRTFYTNETLVVRIHFSAQQRVDKPQFGLALHHANGFHISGPNTTLSGLDIEAIEGIGYVDYVIDRLPLLAGTYLLSASLYNYEGDQAYDHHHQAYRFRVLTRDDVGEKYGSIYIPSNWTVNQAEKGN
jgi:lipopolysaccharide transport system ATP-binding protein